MRIQNINRITINTADINAPIDFYGKVLGFEQQETVGFDGFSSVYFKIPGGGRLELFDYGEKNPRNMREETESGLKPAALCSIKQLSSCERCSRRIIDFHSVRKRRGG